MTFFGAVLVFLAGVSAGIAAVTALHKRTAGQHQQNLWVLLPGAIVCATVLTFFGGILIHSGNNDAIKHATKVTTNKAETQCRGSEGP